MGNWGHGLTVLILLVVLASGPVLGTGTGPGGPTGGQASTDTSPTVVTDCRTIDTPGRYVLGEDIENSTAEECIAILTSNVTFDGQGHTLDARDVDHRTEAIAAGYTDPPIRNITITNLTVTDWTQGIGCRKVATNVTIDNVTARRNGLDVDAGTGYEQDTEAYGIYVGDMTRNVNVTDSFAINNSIGIFIANTSNNVLRGNVVTNNPGGGIVLDGNTWHNRIVNNRVVANGFAGMKVGSRPDRRRNTRTTIRGNFLRGNERGIFLQHTNTAISVANNRIVNTTRSSMLVTVVDGNVTITNNRIQDGGADGIVLDATSNVVLRNNTIRNVTGTGIVLEHESRGNRLEDNSILGAQRGLLVTDTAGRTTIRGLSLAASRGSSIVFAGSGENQLANAIVRGGDIVVESSGNRLRNVTLASGRISFTGTDIRLSAVGELPATPADLYTVGVGVHVRRIGEQAGGEQQARDPSAVLTVYYPAAAGNVSLWQWSTRHKWEVLTNTTVHPTRSAISAPLPAGDEFLIAPLSTTPFVTPTRTPTATPTTTETVTLTGYPTTTNTADSPDQTEITTPGFEIDIALLTALFLLGSVVFGMEKSS